MEKIKNMSPDSKNKFRNLESGLGKAFTLVELIVVITILAILGTIAFISLQGYSRDARDSTRTADLNNIKTSLELYTLQTGEYPKPDSYSTVEYSGSTIWYQGILGEKVTTNLKQLNEQPLDPLTSEPYTYSVTNSYKEYEILALYEGAVAYQVPSPERGGLGRGLLPQANAVSSTLIPKITGNYNGIYVTTTAYIIPTPSIVTAEPLTGGILVLNNTNIKSQVVTNKLNIPNNSVSGTNTGTLTIKLSVYTGSITNSSSNTQKVTAMNQIQQAYSGSNIISNETIANLLNQTSTGQLVTMIDTIFSVKPTTTISTPVNGACGADNGQTLSSTPTNLCNSGNSTIPILSGNTYTWSCDGANGGSSNSCSASHVNSTSCKMILNAGGSTGNGVYTIDPTGGSAFQAYCDMTTDGGGWTLALGLNTSDGNVAYYDNTNFWTSNSYDTGSTSTPLSTDYKNSKVFSTYSGNKLLVKITDMSDNILAWKTYNLNSTNTLSTFFNSAANTLFTSSTISSNGLTNLATDEPTIKQTGNLYLNTTRGLGGTDLDRISIGGTITDNFGGGIGTWYDPSTGLQRPRADGQLLNCDWAGGNLCRIGSDHDYANANPGRNAQSIYSYKYQFYISN